MAVLKAIREFIVREVLKDSPKGVMTTLPNKDLVELNTQVIAQKLMQNGIDPTTLKNANQVENAIKLIEKRSKVDEGITASQSAKVFDIYLDALFLLHQIILRSTDFFLLPQLNNRLLQIQCNLAMHLLIY